MSSFHLSLGVPALQASVDFFAGVLGARVTHRDASGYVNLELAGVQLTLTQAALPAGEMAGFHFGINMDVTGFNALAERVQSQAPESMAKAPHVVDEGTALERHKMYLRCPAGYLVEIKGR